MLNWCGFSYILKFLFSYWFDVNSRPKADNSCSSSLKNNWEREIYIQKSVTVRRGGIGWWKVGIWRVKGMRGSIDQGMYEETMKDGATSWGTKSWRHEFISKIFTSIDSELVNGKIVSNKNKCMWPSTELCFRIQRIWKDWLGSMKTKKAVNREQMDVARKMENV
jgi:hypothetical protein